MSPKMIELIGLKAAGLAFPRNKYTADEIASLMHSKEGGEMLAKATPAAKAWAFKAVGADRVSQVRDSVVNAELAKLERELKRVKPKESK